MSIQATRGLGDVVLVAGPKVLNGLGTIGMNLLLLRHFGPEQFGVYSLAVASILLFDAVLGSAIDMGVLRLAPLHRESDSERARAVERTAIGFKLTLGLSVAIALLWFAEPLARHFFQSDGHAHLIYISAGATIAMLLLRSAQVHLQVEGNFKLYALVDLTHFFLKFGGIAALLVLGSVSPGLALGLFVLGPASGMALFALLRGTSLFRVLPLRRAPLAELLSCVKWFLLTFCLSSVLARIDLFLLSSWGPIGEVGILSAAYALALGFELLGTYLAVVYSPKVMPLCRESRFGAFYRRFQSRLLLACLGLLVGGVVGVSILGPVLLPPSFEPAGVTFLLLLPGALAAFATFPLTLAFVMFLRPRFIFALDCLSIPVLLAGYALVIPRHGAVGAAVVTSAGRLIKAVMTQIVAWRQTYQLEGPPGEGGFVAATPESWQIGGAS